MSDLENVIEDSLNDATADEIPEVADIATEGSEIPDAAEVADEASDKTVTDEAPLVDSMVKDPVAEEEQVASPEDEFAKKFGLNSKSVTGRENRIPYSRVKKIIEKNEKDLTAKLTKEWEAKSSPQTTEFQTKIKGYEEQLQKVAAFEQVLEKDPKTFLERLAQVPAYKPFFEYVEKLASQQGAPGGIVAPASSAPQEGDPRPLPNKQLADGSKVYDLEGLDALMAWQARQVEKKVSADLEGRLSKRYEPIEKEWKHKEYLASIAPKIDNQIAEARTWPHFVEMEAEIVGILQTDKNISLDGAYRKALNDIILPRLSADRTKIRGEVLAELKTKGASTSMGAGKTVPTQKAGPRSIEDIIAAEIAKVQGG